MSYQSDQNDRQSYLIDTNILIDLEDHHVIKEAYANFSKLAVSHKISVFVHEVAKDDIARDKNVQRREISFSKISKYQIIHKCRDLQNSELEADFGPFKNDNDVIDATLLHVLKRNVVDFLVTQDKGLHDRAQRYSSELGRRVLFMADATELLKQTYEPQSIPIRDVEEIKAYEIDYRQSFFNSLRDSYPDFDQWWENKCVKQHRSCWVVYDNNELAGLVVWKDETGNNTDAVTKAEHIFKICTFKVSEVKRGMKLGELLLKQVLWYVQKNRYNLAYLTTYPGQDSLRSLLEFYGFYHAGENQQGEFVYERGFASGRLSKKLGEGSFEIDRKNYPRFIVMKETCSFIVPIQEKYHDILYPDLCQHEFSQLDFFQSKASQSKKPGNTIRKVYLCRAPSNLGDPGSILFFYKSRSESSPSQAITTLGILENMTCATSPRELMQFTGGRSVYSEMELMNWKARPDNPVKVINYLLVSYIEKPIKLSKLLDMNIVKSSPQSICKISSNSLRKILDHVNLDFEI